MRKFILVTLAIIPAAIASAQGAAPAPTSSSAPAVSNSTPASSADVEALRQQVQSLTETVKVLQQQVKDQQTVLEKANLARESALPQNPEPSPIAAAATSPAPAASARSRFPTEDTSVVASTTAPAAPSGAGVNENGSALPGSFPTTDTSVVTSTPETISSTGAGASLTQPITIGGGKNYMNISFDGLFALAYSSARDLDHVEVGDHDPQQRGFNARNIELSFRRYVDPAFREGFANIVFKLDNDNQTQVEVEEAFLQTTGLPFNSTAWASGNFSPHSAVSIPRIRTRGILPTIRWSMGACWPADGFARCRRANFMDVADALVFAIHLRRAKRERQHRILVSQSGRQWCFLRSPDD